MALVNGETMTVDGVVYTWNDTTKQWAAPAAAADADTFYVQDVSTPAIRVEPVDEEA